MQLRDVFELNGKRVQTCAPQDTLQHVVEKLVHHNIGSLIVMDNEQMVGIITERDILKCAAANHDSFRTKFVQECMTSHVKTITADVSLTDVMGLMTEHRIRHLPVLNNGELTGVVSIGDIVKAQHHELTQENHFLKSYIQS